MNANELRIGNLVYRTNKLTKEKILIELTASDILDVSANGEMSYFIYKTIPLTEEWLSKLNYLPFINNHYTISGHQIFKCNDILLCDKTGNVLKHVHKLQNLYFALTNKELEINI